MSAIRDISSITFWSHLKYTSVNIYLVGVKPLSVMQSIFYRDGKTELFGVRMCVALS